MSARRRLWLAGLLALAGRVEAEDTELWLHAFQRQARDRGGEIEVFEIAKFRDNGTQLSEYLVEGGPVYALGNGWQLAPWMHFGEVRSGTAWSYELEPSVNALYRRTGGWVAVGARTRVEYHERGDARNGWKLRGRVTIAPGRSWKPAVKPYLSEEAFDDFRVHRVDQNRLFLGTQFPLGRKWDGEVYFGWRSDLAASRWTNRRIVGVRANWSL